MDINDPTIIYPFAFSSLYLDPNSKIAVCKSPSTSITYIAVWDTYSNLALFEYETLALRTNTEIPDYNPSASNFITEINFDPKCKYMII